MPTLAVRIERSSHAKLRALAAETDEPMVTVLEKAIEEYRRAHFLRKANEDFARLRQNRKEWQEELKERRVWDRTIGDGLGKE